MKSLCNPQPCGALLRRAGRTGTAAIIVLSACGRTSPPSHQKLEKPPPWTLEASACPEGAPGPAGKDGQGHSGFRLKARYLIGEDTSQQMVGFYDDELDARCSFSDGGEAEPGVLRCYPIDVLRIDVDPVSIGWSDPNCQNWVIRNRSIDSSQGDLIDQKFARSTTHGTIWWIEPWQSGEPIYRYKTATPSGDVELDSNGNPICIPFEDTAPHEPVSVLTKLYPELFVEGIEAHD